MGVDLLDPALCWAACVDAEQLNLAALKWLDDEKLRELESLGYVR